MKENKNDHPFGQTDSSKQQNRGDQLNEASRQRSGEYSADDEMDDMEKNDDESISMIDDDDDALFDEGENTQMNRQNNEESIYGSGSSTNR